MPAPFAPSIGSMENGVFRRWNYVACVSKWKMTSENLCNEKWSQFLWLLYYRSLHSTGRKLFSSSTTSSLHRDESDEQSITRCHVNLRISHSVTIASGVNRITFHHLISSPMAHATFNLNKCFLCAIRCYFSPCQLPEWEIKYPQCVGEAIWEREMNANSFAETRNYDSRNAFKFLSFSFPFAEMNFIAFALESSSGSVCTSTSGECESRSFVAQYFKCETRFTISLSTISYSYTTTTTTTLQLQCRSPTATYSIPTCHTSSVAMVMIAAATPKKRQEQQTKNIWKMEKL